MEAAGADAVALLAGVVGVAPDEEATVEAWGAAEDMTDAPGAESTSLGAGSFHADLAGGGAGSRCCGACGIFWTGRKREKGGKKRGECFSLFGSAGGR